MIVYRFRTPNRQGTKKKRESDEILSASDYWAGRIVWVADSQGVRHEYFCTGRGTEVAPREEYFKLRAEQIAERVKRHRSRPRSVHQRSAHSAFFGGLSGYYSS